MRMSRYAIHALLGVTPSGQTDEASREAISLDEALALVRELIVAVPTFRAVTIMHVEDLPLTLQGATAVADVSTDAAPPVVRKEPDA